MAAKKPKKPTLADWMRRARIAELRIPQLETERNEALADMPKWTELAASIHELREQRDEATGLLAEMTTRMEIAAEDASHQRTLATMAKNNLRVMEIRMYRMQGYIDHARERARLENGFDPRPAAYPSEGERNSQNPANERSSTGGRR